MEKMRLKNLCIILLLVLFIGCKSKEKTTDANTVKLPALEVSPIPKKKEYRASNKRENDLLHTKLKISFDWEKRHLLGKAELDFRPYYYPTNQLVLHAKGFDLHKVALILPDRLLDLNYTYEDSLHLIITLNRTYTRHEKYSLFIDYTAKPDELPEGGSDAIESDKGLFFINPDGTEKDKPQQIWTQGETEASSCWFPTIDAPNEKMTQELYITVGDSMQTLSNGLLMYQELHSDSTRTDYWKMDQEHAPYLCMITVGDFTIIQDHWRDIDVNYYVERDYAKYAKNIFGKTPEMLEFFSDILSVDFPWEKYHQVIVRDYVSGAMENTTAVIFGEFIQQTAEEQLDKSYENIVAHELFHHWFGDLVTCESWSNLPLNEAFATYGEYLWSEYKYGRDEADYVLMTELRAYLEESHSKKENLIRFYYEDKEDMFDSHSYSKGGAILHMLRKYVGEEAFFDALNLYLTKNKFETVEIHDLRLAFEKITGEDLNWFFNQWFLNKSHPELKIHYQFEDSTKTQGILIEQSQNFANTPLYILPLKVDFYFKDTVIQKQIWLEDESQFFRFEFDSEPLLINVDADKSLVGEKMDYKGGVDKWVYQYEHAPLFLDRYESVDSLGESTSIQAINTVIKAMGDPFWKIREKSLLSLRFAIREKENEVKEKMKTLAKEDMRPEVRSLTFEKMSDYFEHDSTLKEFYLQGLKDVSAMVKGSALEALHKTDTLLALQKAKELEFSENGDLQVAIATIYAKSARPENHLFFLENARKLTSYNRYTLLNAYSLYLSEIETTELDTAIDFVTNLALNEPKWWMRLTGVDILLNMKNKYEEDIETLNTLVGKNPEDSTSKKLLHHFEEKYKMVEAAIKTVKETEKNPQVLEYLKD